MRNCFDQHSAKIYAPQVSSYSNKINNPLFAQQKVEMKKLIKKLKLMLLKTDVSMAAREI